MHDCPVTVPDQAQRMCPRIWAELTVRILLAVSVLAAGSVQMFNILLCYCTLNQNQSQGYFTVF